MWHMFFCAALAIALVRLGVVQSINMDQSTYLRRDAAGAALRCWLRTASRCS
jgi:hypothetical protein